MNERVILPVLSDGKPASHVEVHFQKPINQTQNDTYCVLYLHGFGTNKCSDKAEYFREQVLAAGLTYCSFDFQGHGGSGGLFSELTLTRNLADTALVHHYLRSIGFSKIIIIGTSMGAITGLWHAAKNKDEIIAGLYLSPALNMTVAAFVRSGDNAQNWRKTGILKFMHRGVDRELNWEFVADLQVYTASQLANDYCIPSLVAQGKQDALFAWKFVQEWVDQCCDKVHLQLYDDGDHLLIEQKEHIWEAFYDFLLEQGIIHTQHA